MAIALVSQAIALQHGMGSLWAERDIFIHSVFRCTRRGVIGCINLGFTLPSRNPGANRRDQVAGAKPELRPRPTLAAIVALTIGEGPAGRLLRAALPLALTVIGLSGLAALGAHRLGLVGTAVGAALLAIANALVVMATLYWAAWRLDAEYVARRNLQGESERHASHDPLTGLANRGFFITQLARRAALAGRRTSMPFAVCSLALDGFARLAEQVGPDAADRALITVADTLRDCVRASDLVARLDGDNFGILLEEIADAKDVNLLAQRIVSAMPPALAEIGGAPVSVSLGIVLKISGEDRPGDMLRDAAAALALAKARGPGHFELIAPTDRPG